MPVLQEETCLFPQDLFEVAHSAGDSLGRWWVVYTRARQEKALARHLLGREVAYYLPQVGRTYLCRGRRVRSHVPLFPGYVFVHGAENARLAALASNRVSTILRVDDSERLTRDLQQIHRLIAANTPLTPESQWSPGKRARICQGPLAGIEGTLAKRRGETRFLICIDFIQQGASFEVEDYQLEPVD